MWTKSGDVRNMAFEAIDDAFDSDVEVVCREGFFILVLCFLEQCTYW